MFSFNVQTFAVYLFAYLHISNCNTQKRPIPCFKNNVKIDIHQFDPRISLTFINCTRLIEKNLFTITFELQRRLKNIDHMFESNMVVTLFSGPCSSSTATLNIGRTFPSRYASLDGSQPSAIASSHLPSNEYSQRGTISYEYGGSDGRYARLTSALIHMVIRNGRKDMINGIYVMKFND